MEKLNGVQGKIKCLYKVQSKEIPSKKRPGQTYTIEATDTLCTEAETALEYGQPIVTEKVDGTCCMINHYKGKPYLWARLDRKPTKIAMKRFKKFQDQKKNCSQNKNAEAPKFSWKIPEDLKEVPEDWIPAFNVELDATTNFPIPDDNGHIPGWVPVEQHSKQYQWHGSTVDYDKGVALTLCACENPKKARFEIKDTPLGKLVGKTFELIGTNINANSYKLGSKLQPFHVLVEHGEIKLPIYPALTNNDCVVRWFREDEQANIEGIVVHCKNGLLFKLHRHHLHMEWPLKDSEPSLSISSVWYNISEANGSNYIEKSSFYLAIKFCNNKVLNKLCESF